jgi:hypothetical protein
MSSCEAMAAPGITLIKTFNYRGAAEEWGNTYHMRDAATDPASWRDAVDGLIDQEKTVYSDRVTIVRALCYEDTDDNAVYTYILADFAGNVPGTLGGTGGSATPGDVAGWVRWFTGDLNSKGKAVYLRKYFHDVQVNGAPNEDQITTLQVAAYQAFGDALMSSLTGGFTLAKPNGDVPDGPARASTYATTRTLHRRGRRP